MSLTQPILEEIHRERRAQTLNVGLDPDKHTSASLELTDLEKLALMIEETGVLASTVNTADVHGSNHDYLYRQLIAIAVQAVGWAESIQFKRLYTQQILPFYVRNHGQALTQIPIEIKTIDQEGERQASEDIRQPEALPRDETTTPEESRKEIQEVDWQKENPYAHIGEADEVDYPDSYPEDYEG